MKHYEKNTLVQDKYDGTIFIILRSRFNNIDGKRKIVYVCIQPHLPFEVHYRYHDQLQELQTDKKCP
tara:strand:+ start:771 stop:971 length:201 start_codon:yes stop_codon:yes gene_type:complete